MGCGQMGGGRESEKACTRSQSEPLRSRLELQRFVQAASTAAGPLCRSDDIRWRNTRYGLTTVLLRAPVVWKNAHARMSLDRDHKASRVSRLASVTHMVYRLNIGGSNAAQ